LFPVIADLTRNLPKKIIKIFGAFFIFLIIIKEFRSEKLAEKKLRCRRLFIFLYLWVKKTAKRLDENDKACS